MIAAWHDDFTVSVEETMVYPIEKVPFPTVTLCPQNTIFGSTVEFPSILLIQFLIFKVVYDMISISCVQLCDASILQ
jgi:hypothetical protein